MIECTVEFTEILFRRRRRIEFDNLLIIIIFN